ncbi:MAG TPA: hypothetical protein VFQ49_03650 [Actinomycetes bacterium]|nr:hypothetical protein [Actinomycetes bacterium]
MATPAMAAAWLLGRAWWRQAHPQLTTLDGPGWLLATATLPTSRRHWGQAMAAELPQIPGQRARWRFAAGCARTALLPRPGAGPR